MCIVCQLKNNREHRRTWPFFLRGWTQKTKQEQEENERAVGAMWWKTEPFLLKGTRVI